jgi:hypothetical protein
MNHSLIGLGLLALAGVALWRSADYTEAFPDVPDWLEPVLRLAGAALLAVALLSLTVVGIRCLIWGSW